MNISIKMARSNDNSVPHFYSLAPDSVGALDGYLTPFCENDIKVGAKTKDEAKEYLQELFLMLQAKTPLRGNFTRAAKRIFEILFNDEVDRVRMWQKKITDLQKCRSVTSFLKT